MKSHSTLAQFKAVYTFLDGSYLLHNHIISLLPQGKRQLRSINNINTVHLRPVASVFKPVFVRRSHQKNPAFSPDLLTETDNPCRAQDACDLLSPHSLRAPPPAPVHRDEKTGQGQRTQSCKTQTHTRKVRVHSRV